MKKLIALLLVMLTLALIPCAAYAEGEKQDVAPAEAPVEEAEDTIAEYYWKDIVPYLEAFGFEGKFYTLHYFGLDMWVPDALAFQELSDGSVLCYVNDLPVLEYLLPEKDCFVCDLHVNDGSILEFVWGPFSDGTYAVNAGFMSNSLMITSD